LKIEAMFLVGCCAALTVLTAHAQSGATPAATGPSEAASGSGDAPIVSLPVGEILGIVSDDAEVAAKLDRICYPQYPRKKLPKGAMVVVVKKSDCVGSHNVNRRTHFEVFFDGEKYFAEMGDIWLQDGSLQRLTEVTPEQRDASLSRWADLSKLMTLRQKSSAVKALEATKSSGIALLKTRIFDVSEHTEGTGFSVELYNSGTKTIKYVSFSVVGLNAVKDVVRDPIRRNAAASFRGVGPIEPGGVASYSKDYFWMTDLVESFRIAEIKLEFMDGTSRVLKDTAKLRIDPKDYAILMVD
jgi:hypothetical protein